MKRTATLLALNWAGSFVLITLLVSARVDDREIFIKGGNVNGIEIGPFIMDKNLVTVADYLEFTKATGYQTEAEKFGSAGVFSADHGTFLAIEGSNFRFPFGPDGLPAELDHPVTQVSYNDAVAYANWKGKRLPTRAEWEYAAAAGRNSEYSWGDDLVVEGKFKANTWQGAFPFTNLKSDGYEFTSPVGVFGENPWGFTDMGGNVWQWCSDSVDPVGYEKIIDPGPRKVLKGGSYLCDPAVCHGYRIFGETYTTPESALGHIGFRCVRDVRPSIGSK